MTDKVRITLLPLNQSFEVAKESQLHDILFNYGVEFPCGGHARCRGCRVWIKQGHLPVTEPQKNILDDDELNKGWRLACQGSVQNDLTIELDQWKSDVLSDGSNFHFSPMDGLGIAIDLGTTTLAAQLVDRKTGEVLAVETSINPQAKYGGDIMTRIDTASRLEKQNEMQRLIRSKLNEMIVDLFHHSNEKISKLKRIIIVGNAVMHNIFCGIDVEPMGYHPFEPVSNELEIYKSSTLGWDLNEDVTIEFLPGVGSFIGSDILIGAWAKNMVESNEIRVLVDLGTNGEIMVGNKDKILAASTAAGPAFEGAGISMGMRAATGAISSVITRNGDIIPKVLGSENARGICGSGLVDAISAYLDDGSIKADGRFLNGESIIVSDPVVITQKDIRGLQLAKGAIATGIRLLLKVFDKTEKDVEKVYLSGAFGNYISKQSARRIGLLNFPQKKITTAGNTALLGAKMALFNQSEINNFYEIREIITHLDLSMHPDFTDVFAELVNFPIKREMV
ncbi:MAG: ASKHA domain-containing protein [Candidatus Marinimicrobia bacterium]|nr:ASKHA domain-containing protein [Candidatus Neomarinimicrobiota bacterium]MDP6611546.1 ASKHA domain-containing protein [Candidatus Neomarinimicrobiota bacterium]